MTALVVLVLFVMSPLGVAQNLTNYTEEAARLWAVRYNEEAEVIKNRDVETKWNYYTNITDTNLNQTLVVASTVAAFDKASSEEASKFDFHNFLDRTLSRQFHKIAGLGMAALPPDKFRRMNQLRSSMRNIYSTAKVCNRPGDRSGKCYPLSPDLVDIMHNSTNWNELLWAWKGWRDASGKKMPEMFAEFAQLSNEGAVNNGYRDNGAFWRSWYESDTFRQDCENLYNQLRPLYEQLHAYVLRKLKTRYPTGTFPDEGHIPAHILGDMWAQEWSSLQSLVRPFPNKAILDVTNELKRQGYNATGLLRLSDEFFQSLGLVAMPQVLYDKSMIVKPPDRDVVCHASAWDFANGRDFRIKQCTEIDMHWLLTTHHEMGHIQYYLQYRHLPVNFRRGANPGFHEAIGDTLALSVCTPEHLQKIGLLSDFTDDPDGDLNFLMKQALTKIAFIPFGYLIDQWRWDVFSGAVSQKQYNEKWWEARCKYQGVSPPVARSSNDFDAGAKYHVAENTPYIRYFVSYILQFQFHKALCDAANNTRPLHRCDIYHSRAAGTLMSNMMRLGSSVHWSEALQMIANTTRISAEPFVEYFRPLLVWLRQQNRGQRVGWTNSCPRAKVPKNTAVAVFQRPVQLWLLCYAAFVVYIIPQG